MYENFKYIEGTAKKCATVDVVYSFLWFKWKKPLNIIKGGDGLWRSARTSWFTEGYEVEFLERVLNANTTS